MEGRQAGCAPPRSTAKPHCHREPLSLKSTWEPAEGLVYNQACNERSTQRQAEGRRSHLPGHCAPSGDTGQEGAVTGVGSSRGMRGILSTNPWAQEQDDESPAFTGLQTSGVCQRGAGHQEAAQGCLLPVTGNCKPPRAQAGLRDLVICISPSSGPAAQAPWQDRWAFGCPRGSGAEITCRVCNMGRQVFPALLETPTQDTVRDMAHGGQGGRWAKSKEDVLLNSEIHFLFLQHR